MCVLFKRSHYRSMDCSEVLRKCSNCSTCWTGSNNSIHLIFLSVQTPEQKYCSVQGMTFTDAKASCLHCCCGGHALHSCNGCNLLESHS